MFRNLVRRNIQLYAGVHYKTLFCKHQKHTDLWFYNSVLAGWSSFPVEPLTHMCHLLSTPDGPDAVAMVTLLPWQPESNPPHQSPERFQSPCAASHGAPRTTRTEADPAGWSWWRETVQVMNETGEPDRQVQSRHTDRSLTRCALGAVCPSCPTVQ